MGTRKGGGTKQTLDDRDLQSSAQMVVCMHIFMMQNLGRLLGDSVNERPRHEVMECVY